MVEGGRLESDWAAMPRRFESCLFRQKRKKRACFIVLFLKEALRITYPFASAKIKQVVEKQSFFSSLKEIKI